jgi:hypothetical protein
MDGASGWARVRRITGMPTVPISLLALATYIRRHRIQLIHGTEKPRDAFYGVVLGKLTGARSLIRMHVSYSEWQSYAVKWAMGCPRLGRRFAGKGACAID